MSHNLKSFSWQYAYTTSAVKPDGRAVDILHDFYIPALRLSVAYDRVAGYFRSSSLAAASQGFSAFTGAGGHMRLIVGADLEADDVGAILEGDQQRLVQALSQRLAPASHWPEDVTNGVRLLSWMVARAVLEVRVAFRVHAKTGHPLAFADAADGYVHEKWAVFTDTDGNRLYISGSLNESKTALIHNAENIDVHADWWNPIERRRADDAQQTFEALWQDNHPHLRVLSLPDAVREKLIAFGQDATPVEIDGSSAIRPQVAPPTALERLQFAVIRDGPKMPGGRYVGMATAPVAPWPHQEVVARRLIETWPYSYLLCDEVGLGKTIEAGLAIRSLLLSGLVRRVLIAPPAALTRQWQREMASKFFLPFYRALSGTVPRHEVIFPAEDTVSAPSVFAPDLCIVSTGLVSRPERREELRSAPAFDIALVDEAHYARRRNPKNGARSHPQFGNLYRVMHDTLRHKATSLWMATATPMQLDWIEVFDLLALTDRVGCFQFDPSLMWAYYEALGALVRDTAISDGQWQLLRRAIATLQHQDPFLWAYLQEAVIDGRIRTAARMWLEQAIVPHGVDRRHIRRLVFAAAPLSRVMLRHGRSLLEIYRENGKLGARLAHRHVLPIPRIVLEGLEKRAYEDLETYCQELTAKLAANAEGKAWQTSLGLYLSFLRLRLASSMFAIRETLRRRKERVEATLRHHNAEENTAAEPMDDIGDDLDDGEDTDERIVDELLKDRTPEDLIWEQERLDQMLTVLEDLSETPLKTRELLRVLNKRRQPGGRLRQTVIFTRFYDTLQDLVARLRQVDGTMLIGTYSGQGGQYTDPRTHRLRGTERDEIKHRFLRGEIDVLICTDAAAEGLNLQTADLLINYDLPWNPMKVEQRIGRIDRIGQRHDDIYVLNLCYADSAEQIVYERLLNRLVQAGFVVGTQQVSMLPVTREEFNELAAKQLSENVLAQRARERLEAQLRRSQSMEIAAADLYDIYMRLKDRYEAQRLPICLSSIWEALAGSRHLRDLGCTVSTQPHGVMTIRGLENVMDGTRITVDRDLYEHGMDDAGRLLHFAAYGDVVFDELLKVFERHERPGCIQRLTEAVPDTHAEVASYAVACIGADGNRQVRLIVSWDDLKGLVLDEETLLDESALASAKQQLHDLVRAEFDPTRTVARLERENRRAAHAQIVLDLLVINQLIPPLDVSVGENFWATVKDIDNLIEQREALLIPNLPVPVLKRLRGATLVDVPTPQLGETTSPTVPILLVSAGLDGACRIADSLKVRRAALTIETVKARLKREIDHHLNKFRNA